MRKKKTSISRSLCVARGRFEPACGRQAPVRRGGYESIHPPERTKKDFYF